MAIGFLALAAICLLLVVFFNSSRKDKACELTDLPQPLAEVLKRVRAGKKIEAIEVYRQQTGVSLADAKSVVGHYSSGA